MTDALTFDITAEYTEETYKNLKNNRTTQEIRESVMKQTKNILMQHPDYANVKLDLESVSSSLTFKELTGVMVANDMLVQELEKRDEMTRLDHLKAFVTGEVQ